MTPKPKKNNNCTKAVEIAKDAIKWVRSGKAVATTGRYLYHDALQFKPV